MDYLCFGHIVGLMLYIQHILWPLKGTFIISRDSNITFSVEVLGNVTFWMTASRISKAWMTGELKELTFSDSNVSKFCLMTLKMHMYNDQTCIHKCPPAPTSIFSPCSISIILFSLLKLGKILLYKRCFAWEWNMHPFWRWVYIYIYFSEMAAAIQLYEDVRVHTVFGLWIIWKIWTKKSWSILRLEITFLPHP